MGKDSVEMSLNGSGKFTHGVEQAPPCRLHFAVDVTAPSQQAPFGPASVGDLVDVLQLQFQLIGLTGLKHLMVERVHVALLSLREVLRVLAP